MYLKTKVYARSNLKTGVRCLDSIPLSHTPLTKFFFTSPNPPESLDYCLRVLGSISVCVACVLRYNSTYLQFAAPPQLPGFVGDCGLFRPGGGFFWTSDLKFGKIKINRSQGGREGGDIYGEGN